LSTPEPTTVRRIEKPWGYEDIFAETETYVGKVIFVRGGERLSLQYHEVKDETMTLLSGAAELQVGSSAEQLQTVALARSESVRIRPGVLHRLVALDDCEVLEVSTPHLDDVVRVSDDYGREGTSAP
jgi:mannose-6-phosphate isomerase